MMLEQLKSSIGKESTLIKETKMIKCKCFECYEESVFESHKDAYMSGWDWSDSGKCYCDKCSKASPSHTPPLTTPERLAKEANE